MTAVMAARSLDVDLLARELGNWRTSSRSGPAYHGLADAIRLLIVDGRLPVGARLPSERALAEALHVPRPRRATKPTKASKKRRLEAKAQRSSVKRDRRRPSGGDD